MKTIALLLFFLLVLGGSYELAVGQSAPGENFQQRMTGALSTGSGQQTNSTSNIEDCERLLTMLPTQIRQKNS
jgi:hypothetical protein